MTAAVLLADLRSRGIEVITDGRRLGIRPAGVVTAAERAALRRHKAEVLAMLADPAPTRRLELVFRMNLSHAQPCETPGCADCWP